MAVMNFQASIVFDNGALKQLAKIAKREGITKPFVITDPGLKAVGILDKVVDALEVAPAGVFSDTVANPTEEQVIEVTALYKAAGADGVIALGGGSSMDLSKAVALMSNHDEPLENYAAIVGGTKKITSLPPLIAIPTTSGTGSEVSVGMIVTMKNGRKETFAGPMLIPNVALCDPELTYGLPKMMTAATGMDAVTHCIEAVLVPAVNPPAEGIGLDGIYRALGKGMLERAVADGSDKEARYEMMMASLEGALAFSKGLGGVHALSHAAGRLHEKKLHHGTLNAIFLPHILRFHEGAADEKYARIRQAMGLEPGADIAAAIDTLNEKIGIPKTLKEIGLTAEDGPGVVEYAMKDLAHFGNPKTMTADDYQAIYDKALG